MGIKFDLIYEFANGVSGVKTGWCLKKTVMVEIAFDEKMPERKRDYLLSIPGEGMARLVATMRVTSDDALGIVSHSDNPEDVKVYYTLEQSEECFDLKKGKLYHLTRSFAQETAFEFQEKEIYFSKIEIYQQGKKAAELRLKIEEFTLDDDFYRSQMLDDYRIIDRVSGGGNKLYTVFRAEHKSIKGIEVAIKRPSIYAISRGSRYEKVLARTKSAMNFLSHHPFIPPVLEVAEQESEGRRSVAFIIMKYVQGKQLSRLLKLEELKKHPFSLTETLEIVKKLADVLDYLHENKVVHRGIAPSNILVDRNTRAFYLVGFGYSKLLWDIYDLDMQSYSSIAPDSIRRRMPSTNLDYMPPEFFISPELFDKRGDIYSLGAVFFKLLFSFAPYIYYIFHDRKAKDDRFKSYCYYFGEKITPPTVVDTLKSIEEDLAAKKFPDKQHILKFIASSTENTDRNLLQMASEIIEKCLQLDREQRYRNISELKHDLELLINQNAFQTLKAERVIRGPEQKRKQALAIISQEYLENRIREEARKKRLQEESKTVRQIEELKDKVDRQQRQIKEKDSEIAELKQRREVAEKTAQRETVAGAELQETTDRLRKNLEERKKYCEALEKRIEERQAELDIFQAVDQDIGPGSKLPGSNGIYYTVEKKIGEGGMGAIFKATRSRDGAKVALKVLFEQQHSEVEAGLRFLSENYILLHLDSPYVLKGLDYVQQKFFKYAVVEYVEGDTVDDLLAKQTIRLILDSQAAASPNFREKLEAVLRGEQPITPALRNQLRSYRTHYAPLENDLARQIAIQSAKGLAYLDFLGIVHRDIKTTNVMVSRNTEGPLVKLIDFGIATHPDFRGSITGYQGLIGSIDYISPERFDHSWDIRSDIYSLGIVYYEMLTGLCPFQGSTTQIAVAHMTKDASSPRLLNSQITESEERIILKMLEKKPEDRYQNAQELIDALENMER